MSETTCPGCRTRLEIEDATYPFLSCPRCLAPVANPNLAQPLPPARRSLRVDERARRDRKWTSGALGLLAAFGILGIAAAGAETGLWVLVVAVVIWGVAVSLSGNTDAAGTLARVLLGAFAIVGVFVVLALAVVVFLFIQCLNQGLMH